ncbi:MAG: type I-F CRISPR-associated endoribonuclease Cas6/Csy4, partial [Gammaproteobacteria bacterium]|nr:type I-F CRISPR-associated endoribonuclease Cas6/Csy4 [Gammaproteobacteria bacterium]
MISHYVEIKATVFDEDVHFVVNKVYNRLHGCIASLNLNIGLSFPKMTEVSPGDLIRCFGVESDLNSLKDNAGIEHLRSKGMVILSEIKIVPDTATPVAYVRDR